MRLIDVHVLGDQAFTIASSEDTALKSTLEDPNICKYIWDVRNDANALWFHYGVSLAGIMRAY